MANPFAFRPRKTSLGIYFNDGDSSDWYQQCERGKPNPKLVAAIRAAKSEFLRVWTAPNPEKADKS